jgi:hypothetical protein
MREITLTRNNGRAVAQAVSRWFSTAPARVQLQVSPLLITAEAWVQFCVFSLRTKILISSISGRLRYSPLRYDTQQPPSQCSAGKCQA